ncbi:MAG: helix-turn-helix transcriptional regulator [Candidatus Azambacteria bacterium]|nr:helix-turn-helix transcriptional regulator [Candidatus Azambacteria bacterium]
MRSDYFQYRAPELNFQEFCRKKLSQGDIARILGVHRSYISGLERGRRNPSLLTVHKVAKALSVKANELL